MSATRVFLIVACLATALPPVASAGEVRLVIRDGQVTLVAKDATLRQILAEWSRVGKTRIVNAERVPGGPVSIELKDVPEAQALATLLRPLAGYMAAPRMAEEASLSRFDRIVVMPSLAAAPTIQMTSAASPSRPAAAPAPRFPGSTGPGGMPNRFLGRPPDPGMNAGDPTEVDEPVDEEEDVPADEEPDETEARPPVGLRQPGMMPATNEVPPHPTSVYDPAGFGSAPKGQQPFQPGMIPTPGTGAALPGTMVPGQTGGKPPSTPPRPPGIPR